MRKRVCDKCRKEIEPGKRYIKCIDVGDKVKDTSNHGRTMNGLADICLDCWKELWRKWQP